MVGEVFALDLFHTEQGVWRAKVVEITETKQINIPGTDAKTDVQTLNIRLLEGERKGEILRLENDYIQLKEGDKFYLNYLFTDQGDEIFSVLEVDRRDKMFILFALFVVTILIFGGWQGFRSLLSLAGSFLVIGYILLPQIVAGISPVLISIIVASAILFFAIFFTHGFNKRSLIAYVGTILSVILTGVLAYLFIDLTSLSGFTSDESIYLDFNTGGTLDFSGLLLAAIIIGALGVLDDIAITQVAVVRELFGSNNKISSREVYHKAMRVGREHVGALVNTLVLAYTGAALPLLLLFSVSDSGVLSIINREIFATEIVRTLAGSIGLIFAVPITTLLAVFVLKECRENLKEKEIGKVCGCVSEKLNRKEKEANINEQILNLLKEKEKITNNDIEKLLGVADSTATKYLQRLEDKGKIKQIGTTGRSVYYCLSNKV